MTTEKARAIFTNDGECDDMNSFVHLLLYANDIDIEGLVASSSVFHYAGDPARGIKPKRWADPTWMEEDLDAYGQVWPNLVAHDPAYPSPDELRAVTCVGNVKTVGDMDEETDGSRLIEAAVMRDDPRPVWLLAGGGTNTIGRALKSIEERHRGSDRWDEVYRHVCDHAVIYMIVTQDDTYADYIARAWPDLPTLHCDSISGIAFIFNEKTNPAESLHVFKGPWLEEHLLSRGPLLARYHTWADGHVYPGEEPRSQFGSNPDLLGGNWWGKEGRDPHDMISEGDSPSFMHLIDVGLRSLEDPGWGGWGGRFEPVADNEFGSRAYWHNARDAGHDTVDPGAWQFSRWICDWMNEFAGRAAWCVSDDYAACNHRPEALVAEGCDIAVTPGQTLTLHGGGTDPDGDPLDFTWFHYPEPGTFEGPVRIEAAGADVTVVVPAAMAPGQTIHLVLRVSDAPAGRSDYMCGYRRVVLTAS